jgi:hypothetical protein
MEASLVRRTENPTKILVVIEDETNVQFLIETLSLDSRFAFASVAESAEEALESARTSEPGIVASITPWPERRPALMQLRGSKNWLTRRPFTAHPEHQARARVPRYRRVPAQDRLNAAPALGSTTDQAGRTLLFFAKHHVREREHVVPGWPSLLRRRWFWITALPRSGCPR